MGDTPPRTLNGITILQVIPELETGGAERTTLEVAEAVIAAGGRAIVASAGGPMVAALEALGATHVRLPLASKNPLVMLANMAKLKTMIHSQGVSIVHARSRAPAWSAWRAARSSGVPFVTTYHGIYKARSGLKRRYNSIMARSDMIIANSEFTRAAVISEHYPATLRDKKKLVTIPRGADLRRFSPSAVDTGRVTALYEAWGGQDALRVLLPGRLTDWKGQSVLIEAARILRVSNPSMQLRVVLAGSAQGRTAYEASLHEAIRGAGVDHMVLLPGNCTDMPAAYLWADVVVSASLRPEAFGRVAVEAQAMGRPVIATNHGGAVETVADGMTGFLVPPGDAAALAAAIQRIDDMPKSDREAMGGMAIARVKEKFSIERMTEATLAVYKKLLPM